MHPEMEIKFQIAKHVNDVFEKSNVRFVQHGKERLPRDAVEMKGERKGNYFD